MTDATFALGARAERPSIFAHIRDVLRRRAVIANTRRELEQLSDRELNDLGISRYDIAAVARSAADRV